MPVVRITSSQLTRSLAPPLIILCVFALWLTGCSKQDLVRVAISNSPKQAAINLVKSRPQAYQHNPLLLIQDAKSFKRNFKQLLSILRGNVEKEWGKGETILASKHRYVKYTQNYKSRARIDFDSGLITVETLDRRAPIKNLESAIITTLLTPDDPRAVDLYSDRTIKLTGTPYLYGLVQDHKGRVVNSPSRAETYARHMVAHSKKSRSLKAGPNKTVHYVQFRMVNNHENIRAKRYSPLVSKYAKRFGISRSLIYAIIKTESNFNPYAVSSAPAYGLMQIVPTTAGRDAYRHTRGVDGIPSQKFLFNSQNNIELGSAYLNLVNRRYLGGIKNSVSREYSTIAAYNTGSGNVLKAFSRDRKQAIRIINGMKPTEVYQRLRSKLNSHEARRYLHKVINARKQYVNI
jgi:membrane-bound lytic murein transglycosylase C